MSHCFVKLSCFKVCAKAYNLGHIHFDCCSCIDTYTCLQLFEIGPLLLILGSKEKCQKSYFSKQSKNTNFVLLHHCLCAKMYFEWAQVNDGPYPGINISNKCDTTTATTTTTTTTTAKKK